MEGLGMCLFLDGKYRDNLLIYVDYSTKMCLTHFFEYIISYSRVQR